MEPLIPGLPDDLARECLFRIHYTQLSTVSSVSRAWKSVLLSREFRHHRDQHCNGNKLILMKGFINRIHKFILLELDTNIWSELPPVPSFPNWLPEIYKFSIASFKWGFVIFGIGVELFHHNIVYVFHYLSETWQRGADIPNEVLRVYECTSDGDRSVYVLLDNFFTSIMVYDVMKDEWSSKIKVEEKLEECFMIYHSGKLHFYDDRVKNFGERVLNVSTWEWEPPQFDFTDEKTKYICVNEDGEWYSFQGDGTLAIYKDLTWKVILKRQEFNNVYFLAMWKSKVLFIREQTEACIFDLKNHEFTTICAPRELTCVFRSNCYLEI